MSQDLLREGDVVLQPWVCKLTFMMQSVLIECVRGPDTIEKYAPIKNLLRWYRRCILYSAFEGNVIDNPADLGGGSFTGPSIHTGDGDRFAMSLPSGWQTAMDDIVSLYLRGVDAIPHHFHLHFIHAVEIVGYYHPTAHIREWWFRVYERLVHDMHLWPETMEQLEKRLGDSKDGWLKRADPATRA